MNEKVKGYLLTVLAIIVIFSIIYPIVFWIRNSELTQIQVLFRIWWDIPLGLGSALLAYKLID